MDKKLLLIDADIVAYKAAVNAEFEVAFDNEDYPGYYWLMTNEKEAIDNAQKKIEKLKSQFKTDEVLLCFSHKQNWRKDVLPTYKAKRVNQRKPMRLREVRHNLAQEYPSKVVPKLEADDVLGLLSTLPNFKPDYQKIIVSEDKDLKSIPGWIFNPAKDTEPAFISEDEADIWFYTQALAGDSTDDYCGCPGMGMVRAEKYLRAKLKPTAYEYTITRGKRKGEVETRYKDEPEPDRWAIVSAFYEQAGLSEDFAITQARVARILRYKDYDFKEKEPMPWTPLKS